MALIAVACFLFFSIIVILDYRTDKLKKYCDETNKEIEDLKKEIKELKQNISDTQSKYK